MLQSTLLKYLALVAVLWSLIGTSASSAESTWVVTGSSGDWHDPAVWLNGIPNSPGDKATLVGGTPTAVTAGLSQAATVGELHLFGATSISLVGNEPLNFNNVAGAGRLVAESLRAGITYTVQTPLGIAAGQELQLDVNNMAALQITKGFLPGNGSLRKLGVGTATLFGGSPGWNGQVFVDAGELRIEHTRSLVDTAGVTVGPGGFLTVVSQNVTAEDSRDDYAIPHLVLAGGTLQTDLGVGEHYTYLNTALELASDSTIQVTTDDTFNLKGGITGSGGVSFLQKPDARLPLALADRTFLRIHGDTSYSGETFVGPNMKVAFLRSAALGDTTAGTHVFGGYLELNEGGGAEQILVEEGELQLNGAATPYGHNVTLVGGQLSGGVEPQPMLTTPVVYSKGASVWGSYDNLLLMAGMSGTGSLGLLGRTEIEGPLSVRGHLYVRGIGASQIAGPADIAGEAFLDAATLTLTGDLAAHDLDFRIAPASLTATPALSIKASNTIGRLVVDPRSSHRDETSYRAVVATEGDAVLYVTEGLRFMGGTLKGNIAGVPNLVKQDRTTGWLEDTAGSGFERIDVEGGQLVLRGDVGDSPPDIWLGTHDTARVYLDNIPSYRGDIYLQNAQGYNGEAAFTLGDNTTFDGNLHLGHVGSSIAAGNYERVASIGPNAVISGNELTVSGRAPLRILGGNHTYTGATYVRAETLILAEGGRLNSTHAIWGAGRLGPGGRAGLLLDNSTHAHDDRIPDATLVLLEGMQLKLVGGGAPEVQETLGSVHTSRGISDVIVENSAAASDSTVLRMQRLERAGGTAVRFQTNNSGAKVLIDEAPALDDGLIGGWALFGGDEFATYGPNGVVPYSSLHSYATDIASAAPDANVRLADAHVTLASDKTVNSLIHSGFSTLDLNGNTLTLESGGLLSTRFGQKTIRGGQLTAGTAANAELLITGELRIESNIVDNPHGAVSLVHSSGTGSSSLLTLTGVNTYSGGTVVNSGSGSAELRITNATALPAGGDVALNGGAIRLQFNADEPLQLGHVNMLDYASFGSGSEFNARVRPESVLIESGGISVPIVGDAPITKIGSGTATINLTQHTGPIFVEKGSLAFSSLGSVPHDEAHAITVMGGGTLSPIGNDVIDGRLIRLDGGVIELRSGVAAPMEILSRGGTFRSGLGTTSIVTGSGPLTIEGGFGNAILLLGADLSQFEGTLTFTGGSIGITRELGYDGVIEVRVADLGTLVANPFGSARVHIRPEGSFGVGNVVTANLHLLGGSLRLQPQIGASEPVLDGDLIVSDHSYVFLPAYDPELPGGSHVASDIALSHLSNLVIAEAAGASTTAQRGLFKHPLSLSGMLSVSDSATVTSYDNPVTIGGTIVAATPQATLNLVGNDTFEITGAVDLTNGNSLTILEDGVPATVEFSGANSMLSGIGTLGADATVSNGGVLAPGNSPGHLTVAGNLEIGGGAVYEWEISDPDGTAGVDWDLLEVDGNLMLSATPDDPWILRLADLSSLLQADAPLLIATAESISGFDLAAVQFEIPAPAGALSAGVQIVAFSDGANLFIAAVPEPCGLVLACVAGMVAVGRRVKRPVEGIRALPLAQ